MPGFISFDYIPRARLQWFFSDLFLNFSYFMYDMCGCHVPQYMCGNQNNSVESFLSFLHFTEFQWSDSGHQACTVEWQKPAYLLSHLTSLWMDLIFTNFLFEGLPFPLLKLWVCFLTKPRDLISSIEAALNFVPSSWKLVCYSTTLTRNHSKSFFLESCV